MSEEQRKYIRFGCLLPAQVARIEENTQILSEAKIDDFSRDGIRLKMNFNFKQGSTVMLNVRNPKNDEVVPVEAEIVWKKHTNDSIELGLKIKNIESASKSEIMECIYEEWREVKNNSGNNQNSG